MKKSQNGSTKAKAMVSKGFTLIYYAPGRLKLFSRTFLKQV
jgi:hypothetical protein